MDTSRFLTVLRAAVLLAPLPMTACGGGGGGPAPVVSTSIPPVAPSLYQVAPRASLGSNTAVLATGNTALANMPVGTVLPLRQSILDVSPGSVTPFGNGGVTLTNFGNGGGTLTYKGSQTVNGVTGPAFDLNIPSLAVAVTLLPDGTGGPCCGYTDVNGKPVDVLNYTLTGQWNAVNDGTVCGICTSMGVTGFQTPSGNVPTSGQASYLGNGASPNARGSVSGMIYTPGSAGSGTQTATVSGSASSFSINFGSGQVTGTLSGLKATPLSNGVAGTPQDWNQINITGSLSGAVLGGSTSTPTQPLGSLGFGVGATGNIDGALYGPNAEELGAVWSLHDPKTLNTAFGVVAATKQ
jgi:hypothetical protein